MKNLKDYLGKKVAIACRTDEEAKFVNDFLAKNGGRNLYYHWESRKDKPKQYHNYIEFSLNKLPLNCYCHENYHKTIGYTVYEASEFLKFNFQVGKWYKFISYGDINNINYAKIKCFAQDTLSASDWILDGSFEESGAWNINHMSEIELLTDLSEIQPYLPETHPDKQTSMEHSEFKVGDWVKIIQDGDGISSISQVYLNKIGKFVRKQNGKHPFIVDVPNFGNIHCFKIIPVTLEEIETIAGIILGEKPTLKIGTQFEKVYPLTSEEIYNPNEIIIPKITKTKPKIDFTIEKNTFAEINFTPSVKPKKVVKFIKIEKFELTF